MELEILRQNFQMRYGDNDYHTQIVNHAIAAGKSNVPLTYCGYSQGIVNVFRIREKRNRLGSTYGVEELFDKLGALPPKTEFFTGHVVFGRQVGELFVSEDEETIILLGRYNLNLFDITEFISFSTFMYELKRYIAAYQNESLKDAWYSVLSNVAPLSSYVYDRTVFPDKHFTPEEKAYLKTVVDEPVVDDDAHLFTYIRYLLENPKLVFTGMVPITELDLANHPEANTCLKSIAAKRDGSNTLFYS